MSSVKKDLINGFAWSAVEKYSSLILNIGISMVLARLLSPQEYGVVSIATVLISFLSIFATMGIGPAIIQRKDLTQSDLDNLFTFSLLIGLVLSVLLFASANVVADYYKEDSLSNVCKILSINLFFSAANMVPNTLMVKNLKFKAIAKRTLILLAISAPFSIIIAFYGYGYYSLLISPIVTSIGIYIYNRKYYPCKISKSFTIKPIRSIFSYSMYQFLFEFINFFSRNIDKLIIGKFISVSSLGYYDKSYRLMLLPLNNITSVIGPVIQPVLSNIQNERQDIAAKYLKIIFITALLSFPLGIYLYFSAFELIHLFYGNQWDAAIPCFKILALSIPLQVILCTSGSIFQAANATKSLFVVGLRNTIITVLGFLVSCICYGTIEAIACSWTFTTVLVFISTYYTLYKHVLLYNPTTIAKVLLRPIICSIILAISLLLLPDISNYLFSLFFKTIVSLIIVALFIQYSRLYDIIGKFKNLVKK